VRLFIQEQSELNKQSERDLDGLINRNWKIIFIIELHEISKI
jgi:hypothetical protein